MMETSAQQTDALRQPDAHTLQWAAAALPTKIATTAAFALLKNVCQAEFAITLP